MIYESRESLENKVKSLVRKNVYTAFIKVDRKLFVPDDFKKSAYFDASIPLSNTSTISQPSLVAEMIDLLSLKGDENVLEIGTGSGYSSTILSFCCNRVETIEIDEDLAREAKKIHKKLKIKNIKVHVGHGAKGIPEKAPYDAIIFTAAIEKIPDPIFEQLKNEGRIVYPIQEKSRDDQYLVAGIKGVGKIMEERVMTVRFVPLI